MSLLVLLSPVIMDGLAAAAPDMVCDFAAAAERPALEIRISDPREAVSMTGHFKISVDLDGQRVAGSAIPFEKTEARDVVMRAISPDRTLYLIALTDDGSAILRSRENAEDAEVVSRSGTCSDFEPHLNRWLTF